MNTEALVDKSLSSVLATVTQSLVDATKEYGPDAVELGLFVYRMEAVQKLVLASVVSVVLVVFWKMWIKWAKTCRDWSNPDYGFPRGIAGLILSFVTVPLLIEGVGSLFSPFYWVAAFGYPEVLVAYKALEAAGLM